MATIYAGDESGNLDLKFDEGATRYFVIALVRFDNPDSARGEIESFKKMNVLDDRELAFHEISSKRWGNKVFDFLATLTFRGWVLIADKHHLPSYLRTIPDPSRYAQLVIETFTLVPLALREQSVLVLDEFDQSGQALHEIRFGLRVSGIERGFKKIVAKRSSSEPLIQVADLIAGAAHRWKRYGETTLLEAIADKLEIAEFKKKTT